MESTGMKVGITGASGLIGWHLYCLLKSNPAFQPVLASRETFQNSENLDHFVRQCDALVHLAAVNRGSDHEVESINLSLTQKLIDSLERTRHKPHLLYSSSIHANTDSLYGRTKRACGDMFLKWSQAANARYTSLVFPHVFGERGKPFHNSVVSTFCHQVANQVVPTVNSDSQLELLHAQTASTELIREILSPTNESSLFREIRPAGKKISVSQLLREIESIAQTYRKGIIPDLRVPFALDLFNTYRSYLFPAHALTTLQLHSDDRGDLFEAVKSDMGGQCFVSTTKPGISRGNHFHLKKLERFLVTSGEAIIRIRRVGYTDVMEFPVSGSKPQFIDIPTLHTHNITNVGQTNLTTLFWSHEIFDPENPDTFREIV